MTSVVQEWVSNLTFKQQTVLLSALRGCDGKPKEDPSKQLVRALRSFILHNASPGDGKFMSPSDVRAAEKAVTEDLDHYPVHWVMHFAHAAEIIGYKHPDPLARAVWHGIYLSFVDALHLRPESEADLDKRLADGDISPVLKFGPTYTKPEPPLGTIRCSEGKGYNG